MEHHLRKFLTTANFIDYLQKQLREMFYEKVLLKIFQNLQESTCVGVSFSACTFIKKETLTQVFLVNFAKFLRTPFLQTTHGRQLRQLQPTASVCTNDIHYLKWSNKILFWVYRLWLTRQESFHKIHLFPYNNYPNLHIYTKLLKFR